MQSARFLPNRIQVGVEICIWWLLIRTDMLVQHFLGEMNEQYYCLYPPTFLHDYAAWWSGKASGQALAPEFTGLLLQVCACATLYLDAEGKQRLESELGGNSQTLAEQYHRTATQLSHTIGPGKGGLTQVQQLFINAVWYKTEALFVESWHALGAAIHEAQELGLQLPRCSGGLLIWHRNAPQLHQGEGVRI